jgi:hypothetical protein
MESLNYAYRQKCWGIPGLILILLITANIASADVSISNSYYTSGSESHENVVLHNMVYSNDASVFGDSYSTSSEASTANQSETSKFSDTAHSSSLQGPQAYGLQAKGSNDIGYSRSLSGGSVLYTSLNYNMETKTLPGALQIKYSNPQVLFDDNIYNLVNNKYTGTLVMYGSTAFSLGRGTSNGDAPGSFHDIISYQFFNKDCKMDSFFEAPGATPVDYMWKTFSSQGHGNVAVTGIDISADALAEIKGTSSFLDDKFSINLKEDGTFAPIYMRYVLNNSK